MVLAQLIRDLNQALNASGPVVSEEPVPAACSASIAVRFDSDLPPAPPTLDAFLAGPDAAQASQSMGVMSGMARLFGVLPPIFASISASSSSLYFGDVKVNSSTSKSFSISNNSDCPVDVSSSGTPSGFSMFPTSTRISANSSASFTVTFNPSFEQSYSGYINFSPGVTSVSVSGRGVK